MRMFSTPKRSSKNRCEVSSGVATQARTAKLQASSNGRRILVSRPCSRQGKRSAKDTKDTKDSKDNTDRVPFEQTSLSLAVFGVLDVLLRSGYASALISSRPPHAAVALRRQR